MEREVIPFHHSKSNSSQEGKKKDLSRIECFHCHELGHYATKFLHKKIRKKPSGAPASGFHPHFLYGDIHDG